MCSQSINLIQLPNDQLRTTNTPYWFFSLSSVIISSSFCDLWSKWLVSTSHGHLRPVALTVVLVLSVVLNEETAPSHWIQNTSLKTHTPSAQSVKAFAYRPLSPILGIHQCRHASFVNIRSVAWTETGSYILHTIRRGPLINVNEKKGRFFFWRIPFYA